MKIHQFTSACSTNLTRSSPAYFYVSGLLFAVVDVLDELVLDSVVEDDDEEDEEVEEVEEVDEVEEVEEVDVVSEH